MDQNQHNNLLPNQNQQRQPKDISEFEKPLNQWIDDIVYGLKESIDESGNVTYGPDYQNGKVLRTMYSLKRDMGLCKEHYLVPEAKDSDYVACRNCSYGTRILRGRQDLREGKIINLFNEI